MQPLNCFVVNSLPCLIFCDFSCYHKSHLSWKYHWNVQEIWKLSPSILTISLLKKNWCRQHITSDVSIFFTFNLLWIHCLTVVWSYIDIRLVLLEIWSTWLPPEKNYSLKDRFSRVKTPEWHQLSGEGCITSCCNNPASCWYFLTFYSIYHLIIWNRMHLGHEW